jgi:hypothetical protein
MKIISITVTVRSAVLCMGTMDSCSVVTQANEPHANLCMLYTHNLKILSTDFVGSINTRNICLILSTIYKFYFCECLYRYGPQCTALTGAYIADKTAITVRHSSFTLHEYTSAVHSMV